MSDSEDCGAGDVVCHSLIAKIPLAGQLPEAHLQLHSLLDNPIPPTSTPRLYRLLPTLNPTYDHRLDIRPIKLIEEDGGC